MSLYLLIVGRENMNIGEMSAYIKIKESTLNE